VRQLAFLGDTDREDVPVISPFDRPLAPYVKGSETSREAAEFISQNGRLNAGQRCVLECIAAAGAEGATDLEVEARTPLKGSTVRPRRGEIAAGGYIVKKGERRGEKGHRAEVWLITDAGRDYLAAADLF
jgi:hypothetical protein